MRRFAGTAIYVLSAAIGLLAFAYPFFLTAATRALQARVASLATTALVALALLALLVEMQGQALSSKTVAVLGVLVATASVLRFIEVAIPMPGGFSPVFVPIILAGYVFGARFGFLMGALTLFASALVTGGIGPWLPYQMLTAGWVGLTAGWLGRLFPPTTSQHLSTPILTLFGAAWGLLYGMVMNVYFWPLAAGVAEQTWRPGLGLGETLAHYAAFYLATSLGWDMARALGNGSMLLLLGAPTVRALLRFQRRFQFAQDT